MTTITERGGTITPTQTGSRFKVRVITAGQGSSGLYPAEAIESAAPLIIRGVPMFADHPTVTETYDRPERSVRDLVGFFDTPGEYVIESGEHAVDAEVTILPQWQDSVAAMKDHIGLSIRAQAEVDESGGRRVIKRITAIESVDLVTKAGRGGKVLELLESARPATVTEALASDVRTWLSRAVQAAHGTRDRWTWTRDHDDTYVYFEGENVNDARSAMFRQTYTLGDGDVTLTGEPEEVNAETTYKPVTTPGDTSPPAGTTTESQEDQMPNTTEGKTTTPGQTNTTEADVQAHRAEITEANNRVKAANHLAAELIVAEAFDGIEAPKARTRLVEAAVADAGHDALDADALRESAREAAAEFQAANGAGTPTGLGGTPAPITESASEPSDDDILATLKGEN